MPVQISKGQTQSVKLMEGHEEIGMVEVSWTDEVVNVRVERIDEARVGPLVVTAP